MALGRQSTGDLALGEPPDHFVLNSLPQEVGPPVDGHSRLWRDQGLRPWGDRARRTAIHRCHLRCLDSRLPVSITIHRNDGHVVASPLDQSADLRQSAKAAASRRRDQPCDIREGLLAYEHPVFDDIGGSIVVTPLDSNDAAAAGVLRLPRDHRPRRDVGRHGGNEGDVVKPSPA